MSLEQYTCTGVSLQNNGISLNKIWYTVVGKAAEYLSRFKTGDIVMADIIDQDGGRVVKFVTKDKGASPQQSYPRQEYGPRENFNPQGQQQQTDFNPAFFGMCCNQAMELTLATHKDKDNLELANTYRVNVLELYKINTELRKQLMEAK